MVAAGGGTSVDGSTTTDLLVGAQLAANVLETAKITNQARLSERTPRELERFTFIFCETSRFPNLLNLVFVEPCIIEKPL